MDNHKPLLLMSTLNKNNNELPEYIVRIRYAGLLLELLYMTM